MIRRFARSGWIVVLTLLALGLPVRAQDAAVLSDFATAQVRADGVWITDGAAERLVLPAGDYAEFGQLTWSPDGNWLALTAWHLDRAVLLLAPRQGGEAQTVLAGIRHSGQPISFSAEGDLLYAGQTEEIAEQDGLFGPIFRLLALTPGAASEPRQIGTFIFAPGCGGGSMLPADWRYWEETYFQGNVLTLALTPFGIVHNANCMGSGLALADPLAGEDVLIAPDVQRTRLSPDGTQVLGIDWEGLKLIDLATRAVTAIPTSAYPDQVAWGAPGSNTIYYSERYPGGDSLELSATDLQLLSAALGYEPYAEELDPWVSVLHRVDLHTGADEEVFAGGYYAIGRVVPLPDDAGLLLSTVENASAWVAAILAGELDPMSEAGWIAARELVQTQLHLLNPVTGEAALLGRGLGQVALNPVPLAD